MNKIILIVILVLLTISILGSAPALAEYSKSYVPNGLEKKLDQGKELPEPFKAVLSEESTQNPAYNLTYELDASKETPRVNDAVNFLLTVENNNQEQVKKEYLGVAYSVVINDSAGEQQWEYLGNDSGGEVIFEPGFSASYYGGTFRPSVAGLYNVQVYFMGEPAVGKNFSVTE